MNRLFLATVALLMLFGQQSSWAKSKGEYDVYLLIGQSNMAGRGYMIQSDTLSSIEGVYILNREGEIVEARNPLNQYSTIAKDYSMQQISPAFSFSKRVHEVSGRKILLVVNARGGSSISEWNPDNDKTQFYAEALRRTKQAMEFGELKGVLWHQGCADSSEAKRELYMGRLKKLVEQLREDLGEEDLYFVAGELAYWRSSSPAFNEMLHTIEQEIPHSDYISADGASLRTDETDPHFSREGQILLGERYAEKILEKIYSKEWKRYQKKNK